MKKAAVIGLGMSGQAAVSALTAQGWQVDVYDDNKASALAEYKDDYELTVLSPGIKLDKLPLKPSHLTSEIELGYQMMKSHDEILAVTGTNGKSTVTHLTAQILQKCGVRSVACGNIGYPFLQAVLDNADKEEPVVYVVELSSFQIELLNDVIVAAVALTNITPDHLDRYGAMDAYVAAKLRLLEFIDNKGTLFSVRSGYVPETGHSFKTRWVDEGFKRWPAIKDSMLNFGRYYVDPRLFPLLGEHNLLNLAFALALTNIVHPLYADVTDLVKGLTGMPHRMQVVGEYDEVTWINDSKATNVQSTMVALRSCNYPSIVLLGGRDKKGDFTELLPELRRSATEIIFFGEAAELIYSQLKDKLAIPLIISPSLRLAVKKAKDIAMPGHTVLLSPGCASFDEFRNFEDRGLKFAEYVKEVYDAN